MAKSTDTHDFGSDDTEVKLELIREYSKAYVTALRSKFRHLWYIDGFAGTGVRTQAHLSRPHDFFTDPDAPEWIERRPGSARIALEVAPAFDHVILMDRKKRHAEALESLKAEYPHRSIEVMWGDCNALIREKIASVSWRDRRALLFLDPYGMEVEWSTLEAIAETRAIDVWYLFSLEGLYRNAAHDIADVVPYKAAALTKLLGTENWKSELYTDATYDGDLFPTPEPDVRRNADVKGLERYVTKRLAEIFPLVLPPYALPVRRRGPQRFSLYCMISNPTGPAVGLARKIAGHILTRGR